MPINDLLKTRRAVVCSVAAILCALLAAYLLGAFKSIATGNLLYDVQCLAGYIYRVLIAPVSVGFAIICLVVKTLSLLDEPNKKIEERLGELENDSKWLTGRVRDLQENEDKLIKRIRQLEAKVQVIASILNLTRNDEKSATKTNPLEDC